MECPNCGNTDLLPEFKCCLERGSRLAHDQDHFPSMKPKMVPAVSGEKPKGDAAAKKHNAITSKSLQQNGANTETNQNKSSFNQQLGPVQVPNNLSASPDQWEEAVVENSPRPSSASGHCSDRTPATTDPDNKDFGKAEEIATGFEKRGSAAVTNTPERAETGERQGEGIASEVKQLDHLNFSTLPVLQEEAAAEKGQRPSLESGHCSDRTPATTDPDKKDLQRDEEVANGFVRGISAAVINTLDRAETGVRQGEDFASEQTVDNKSEGKEEEEGSSSQHQSSIPPKQLQGTSEAGVTVVFNVLVPSVFELTDGNLSIQARWVECEDFACSCVTLCAVDRSCKREGKDYLQLYEGQLTLTLDQGRECISYNYVVTNNENHLWEDLTEFFLRRTVFCSVSRALKIPIDYIQPGATWKQFDGVAYFYNGKSCSKDVDQKAEYRAMAFRTYLPKWKGFLMNEATEPMDATTALRRLEHVENGLLNVYVQEGLSQPKWKRTIFNFEKVFNDLLKPKLEANVAILSESEVGSRDHLPALVSSLAIIIVFKKHSIQLEREKGMSLLRCLVCEADSYGEMRSDFKEALAEFNAELRKLAAIAVESLNDTCTSMKSTTEKIDLSGLLAFLMSTSGQQSNTFTGNEDPSSSYRQLQGAARSPTLPVESEHAPPNFSGDRVEIEMKNGVGQSTVHDVEIGTKPEESERNVQHQESRGPVTRAAIERESHHKSDVSPDGEAERLSQSEDEMNLGEGGNGNQETETQQLESKGKLRKGEHQNTDESEGESTAIQRPLIQERITLKQVAPEAGVTVVFHVLLASNFKMNREGLFIRAVGNDLGDFQWNCVDMFLVETLRRKDKERLMLFRGEFTLSLDRTLSGVSYKYVVVKKGNLHWEQLPEFPSSYGGFVNRALKIPVNCIKPGVTWNQVDGVAYVYGDKSMFSRVVDYLSGKDNTAQYRAEALLCFRPKWKGFLVDEIPVKMDATEAVKSLIHVVDCLLHVWIEEKGYFRQEKPTNFYVQKVLWDLLKPKTEDNISTLEKVQDGSSNNVSVVVSSLAILLVVDKYAIKLKREEMNTILKCLALHADAAEQKCSAYEAVLTEFDNELRKDALSTIRRFCNASMEQARTSNPQWLLALPLLHFLRRDSKPFEEPDVGEFPKTLDWWGAQELAIEKFQPSEKQDYTDVWPGLVAAFQVDLLLKRTVLRALSFWALLDLIPTRMFDVSDVCVALVTSFPRGNLNNEKKIFIEKCILSLNTVLEDTNEAISSNMKIMKFRVSASLELVKVCLNSLRHREDVNLICHAIKLLFTSIQHCQHAIEESQTENIDKLQEIETLKKDHLDKLWVKLKSYLKSKLESKMPDNYQNETLPRELEVWSMFLKVTDGTQGFEEYRKYLTKHFMERARTVKGTCLVEIFCELNLEIYDRAIEESISELAFEAVETIIQSGKGNDADHTFMILRSSSMRGDSSAGKYGALLSVLLTKSWPNSHRSHIKSGLEFTTVKFLLTWNPIAGYFRFFGDKSGRGRILTKEGQETLAKAKSVLTAVLESISKATVTVEILMLLRDHKAKFLELLKTTFTSKGEAKSDSEQGVQRILDERIGELEEFLAVKEKVFSFICMCDLIQPVNVDNIKEKVIQDVTFHQLRQLCKRKYGKEIQVKFLEIPQVINEVLTPLRNVQESSTFQDLWTQYGKKAQTVRKNCEEKMPHLSVFAVVENVWKPAFSEWSKHANGVVDGTMTLGDVDKLFKSFKTQEKRLEDELTRMFQLSQAKIVGRFEEFREVVGERMAQIQRYQQLCQYFKAAKTIWQFKEAMGLSGDFTVVQDLCNQSSAEFKEKPLNSIGEKFMDAGVALRSLDVDKEKCLRRVIDSKGLVEWLRTTTETTKELKVLVDLALISAGESDMETDRISSLHTSCLGFAPLIFGLVETEEYKVGFDQLMKACDPVWKAVEGDQMLPQKLYDTSRNLDWLKMVKESHGSLAMTSLVQATTINCSGVYVVGYLGTKKGPSQEQGKRLSLKDVIRLTVPLKDGSAKEQGKTYSIDELKDLQSKLMLIAGKAEKGKDDVEQFVRNLEGVMRLATAYINLYESGFVHLMNWNREFQCEDDFSEGKCIAKDLEDESKGMETCFFNWKKKVSDAREEFRELNFFTTKQLMTLRKEIATVCHSSGLDINNIQVLTLLESVRPNCTSEQLKSAIQRAFKDTDILDNIKGTAELPTFSSVPLQYEMVTRRSVFEKASSSTGISTFPVQAASGKKSKTKKTSKIQSFLNAAADKGFSEQIALAAMASLGVDAEKDDLLFWCLEEADEADLEALNEDAKQNPMIAREVLSKAVDSADQELQAEDLSANESESDVLLKSSWKLTEKDLVDQKTSKDEEAEISQYLTLTQLGNILRELSVKGKQTTNRTFPGFLKRGRPNLMLAPKGDILATVLALYMHDKQQPLPSHEEVLLCTPKTTAEEIELLWRRAIGDMEGRFYCLVHADLLDFSVSKQAVDMLSVVTQGLARKAGEHYGLVIICSSENEDRANIVAALEQCRVAAPPCPSPDDLKSCLKHQLRAPPPPQHGYIGSTKIRWTAAGCLDPESLCVRVVSSNRGGMGKTLFVRRLTEQLPDLENNDLIMTTLRGQDSRTLLHVTVPLHGNSTDSSMVVDALLSHAVKANVPLSRIFHLDVSPSMRRGLDTLLFNLLVLGYLCDKMGRVWRRRSTDLYVIEITTAAPLPMGFTKEEEDENQGSKSGRAALSKLPFYDLLPTIHCDTPRNVLCRLTDTPDSRDCNPLFDIEEFRNAPFQRVYQYLKLSKEGQSLDNFTFLPGNVDDDRKTCLLLLLRNCGITEPSWSEIRHFVSFLNSQLRDCEESFYCDMKLMRTVLAGQNVLNLEGFRSFVVRFMIQMSRDFATPSLTEEDTVFYTVDNEELEGKEIEQFQLRRQWESSPHPYLFFNQDHITLTFLGFFINSAGDLVDPQTGQTLERGLMSKHLRNGLHAQRVDFGTNIETSKKKDKVNQLCSVMGVKWLHDPDSAYELTTDNVKKILAIHMRFRCNIPVIVMGETGCGKTRLIRYMCGLQAGPKGPRNMLHLKVHGGTTYADIELKVHQAEDMALANQDKNIDTVLFFDEANTTEALTMIKEVMVDRRVNGQPIGQGLQRLQFIAACNPYRRHTDDMIHKLESAGLGYHVNADESEDRLGHIPLRHLVYRVHALPGSMRPLIWDFGQLKPDVERLYTNQIVNRYIIRENQLPGDTSTVEAVAEVLAASQIYMRNQSDECSFVSLRDVERAMRVMVWFYEHMDTLGELMDKVIADEPISPLTRALVLAIGVCYHAKLQKRREGYREVVAKSFKAPCLLPGGQEQILREISSCQKAVVNDLELGPNIARNTALSENVFMMVVCIELRIPLFVVGKPGSSKSLAKTVVADNMQGNAARSPLFKTFKQVHMVSYQCSPLSTPEGIMATFKQCSKLQEGQNPDKFVSVVVLDEVGLAEDSPLMPLKTLHPLLEEGVTSADDVIETDEKPQRVAFIGISNWALDPAKMNRGIMLSRGVPEKDELVDSAMGICSTDEGVKNLIQPLLSPLADGYVELYMEQKNFVTLKKWGKDEFFGLRDFYSLIKMVYSIAAKSNRRPRWHELEHAIKRNFGGLIEGDTVEIFKRYYPETDDDVAKTCTTIRLIEASLGREDVADRANFSENRYLLILTENYAALPIIQQHLLKTSDDAVVIFGSSFPNDQEYTQICRNINRIKVYMETGRTVILLNLESLYESLYDALNQYYVYFGGQKYVDLGLGTHRVKCRVHDDFKLIVIAEKDVVYKKFPIPLINRLEKHFLVTLTSLTLEQRDLVQKMNGWAREFSEVLRESRRNRDFPIEDAFVGFHNDTIPSLVMQVCSEIERGNNSSASDDTADTWEMKVFRRCQMVLLEMATPDAIARLPFTALEGDRARSIRNVYFKEQQHSSLAAFMSHVLTLDDNNPDERRKEGLSIQVTTHSRLLSNNDLDEICIKTHFGLSTVALMTLRQFQTEQQFRASVRDFFKRLGGNIRGILVVQCDSGDENFNLIAGARHILLEERTNAPEILDLPSVEAVHIVLIVQLPRIVEGCRNFVAFQGGKWMSTHIDELRPPGRHTPSIEQLIDRPISKLFDCRSEDHMQAMAVELLRTCVQAAACRVDSKTQSAERSTHRIELLLHLLPDDYDQSKEDEDSFGSVLVQRTYRLLKEKESTALDAHGWLHSEALSGTGVQEWGTFRKALLQRIYSVVVPILAEIIAFADKDMNLDLARSDKPWISKLWLKILADPTISELTYSEMVSPGTDSVWERVQVIGSGAGGHRFCCRFPFSFIIMQDVEKMVKEASGASAESRSNTTLLAALRDMINNSQLEHPFKEIRHEDSAAIQYLMDFVHMVYKPSSESEHELVYEAILSSARELGTLEDKDDNESIDIALVHVSHSRVQHRLKYFDALVKTNPGLVPRLRQVLQGNKSEVLLDVVALEICLEALELSREMLLSPDTRRTWCDRVLSIRPVVEDMMRKERFGPVTEKCSNYGEKSKVMLGHCRSMWQRIGAVRLFVEHLTLFTEEDGKANSENVIKLWKALGDKTDFSSLRSLQALEKFLINYSEDVRQRTNEKTASELRRRCNAFFMELVSIFCFGDSVSKDLEEKAISLLMRYVIGHQSSQTKDFSLFPDQAIDPTPVVRSFLLQLLLRSSTGLVKKHLKDFLKGAKDLKQEPSHIKEVCFLYVQCREDLFVSHYQAKVAELNLTLRLKHATKKCEEAVTALTATDVDSAEMSDVSLEGVAKGRYVLALVVELLYKLFVEGDSSYRDEKANREVTKLFESARMLCIGMSSSTPHLYLLKQLVRRHGLDCVRTLGEYEELEWILPLEARQQEEVIQDRFLVHGDQYRAVREGLAKTVIRRNIQDIVSAITETRSQVVYKNVLLLLVMYREITMANISPVQTQNLSQKMREMLDYFLTNGGHLSETALPFAKELLWNSQGGHLRELQIYNGKSPQEHTLAEIVIHTAVALHCVDSGSLAQPLYALMTDPTTMNNSFLPTMPEDNYFECINAIAETMKGTGCVGEWYECSNLDCRYPYFIGECSKPMEKSTCPGCGRVLGGEQHKFSEQSKVSTREDRTKTGHALGEPGSRPTHAEPQRDMPPIVCSLLRIIMHSAMVMGASRNPQAISQLIAPPCPSRSVDSVGQFFWQHLQGDLDVLGGALGCSVDDAALTVHLVLQRMILLNGGRAAKSHHDMRLQTRRSRRSWEKDFCSEIVVPVITNLDKKLQNALKIMMEDEKFGRDPLVRQLYEFDEQEKELSEGVRPMSCALWKYRQHITIEGLSSSFQREVLSGGKQEYKVLEAFLKQEHKLRFVQLLPDVIRLQRLLMDRFHRRIDKTKAENYTISDFLNHLREGSVKKEYTSLFQSFKYAWNSCKSFLGDQGRLSVPQDLCNTPMDNNCPIAMVLPCATGLGVCSTSLTYFLVNANNESLGAYRSAANQDSSLERIAVSEVTLSHLIAYDPERDLLPLILAHCNYSLEVGQETLVHYDWAALERQLIDRLLRGRPFVEFKEERFVFRRDTRDEAVFSSLAGKIPQESISRAIESQIVVDLRSSLSDVCNVLSSLDIAIGFLASSGGQSEKPLKFYLHEVLKLPKDRGLKSPTAEQHCNLSHTLALWRLMALERAKIKSRNKQEPFEQLPDAFKKKPTTKEQTSLSRVLRKIDMDTFLPQLLQIILLNVKKDGETISTMSFGEYLDLCFPEKGLEQIPGAENIPDCIKMMHLKAVWNAAVQLSDDFRKDRQAQNTGANF